MENKWKKSTTVKDQVNYTYDSAGNRLSRDIPATLYATNDRDQVYGYDNLHRLLAFDEGALSGTAISLPVPREQNWILSQLGNWDNWQTQAAGSTVLAQERAHNVANELVDISGLGGAWLDPVHDGAGNMTTIPQPKTPTAGYNLKYDAWNRLAVVFKPSISTTIPHVKYEYDGLNRMIVREVDLTVDNSIDETHHNYYNEDWQVVVEAEGTTSAATAIYCYHPHYVDAVVNRMRSTDSHVYLHDANFNVTALMTSSTTTSTVVERYSYTPYGEATVLNADFSLDSSGGGDGKSDVQNQILYTGRWVDPVTGLQLNRERWYHQPLGRWVSRDPIGYEGGTKNLYEYVATRPTFFEDPSGLVVWIPPKQIDENGCDRNKLRSMRTTVGAEVIWDGWGNPQADGSPANGYSHCVMACLVNQKMPVCNGVLDRAERNSDGTFVNDESEKDDGNNNVGRNNRGDCWKDCNDDYDDGNLWCVIDGKIAPCPPPTCPRDGYLGK